MNYDPLVTIIINNYNYGQFLARAIDSVLNQTYPKLEVIVVDDGSMDNSREVIRRYGDSIVPILKENGGQASALNAGFARSHGEVVIFLDADDALRPTAVEHILRLFCANPNTALVQYRLAMINASDHPTGATIPPLYLPLPRSESWRTVQDLVDCASWSPTSGSAFSVRSLQRLLPMPESDFRVCADYYLVRAAALCGQVLALEEIEGYYRVHGANRFAATTVSLQSMRDRMTVATVAHAHLRNFAQSQSISGYPADVTRVFNEIFLAQRLISLKLDPEHHPLPNDAALWLGLRGIQAALYRANLSPLLKCLHVVWFFAMVLLPRSIAASLAQMFYPEQRSALNKVLVVLQHGMKWFPFQKAYRPEPQPLPEQGKTETLETWAAVSGASDAAAIQEQRATVAVAIVNYNTREHLRECLRTVLSETPSEIVVVDNASTDGSTEMVRTEFPRVVLYANPSNRGYGTAANQAIANCSAPYVLLLNSDTCLQPGSLQMLADYLDQHPQAAIVGPRLVNPDGSLQPSCFPFPTPLHFFIEMSLLGRQIRHVAWLRDRYIRTWSHAHACAVPWVMGAALMIRREAFDSVHGFDESFHTYFEEVDLCYRMTVAGWQVHFTPITSIMHVEGASTRQRHVEMQIQFYASMRQFYQLHYSAQKLVALDTLLNCIMLAKLIRDTLRLLLSQRRSDRARIADDLSVWQSVLFD